MTLWEKPSFEELAMNAEIGAYQPENPEDERSQEPFVQTASEDPQNWAIPVHCG
jgi:hypothetical protein